MPATVARVGTQRSSARLASTKAITRFKRRSGIADGNFLSDADPFAWGAARTWESLHPPGMCDEPACGRTPLFSGLMSGVTFAFDISFSSSIVTEHRNETSAGLVWEKYKQSNWQLAIGREQAQNKARS